MGSSTCSRIRKKNLEIINAILCFNTSQRHVLLQKASKELIILICECALNILLGNVPLDVECKKNLKKYAFILRKLADSKIKSLKIKKNLIIKYQTCLPLILEPVIKLWSTLKE